jgi:hypothetical protein
MTQTRSVISFLRKAADPEDIVLVAGNFTPVARIAYRIGLLINDGARPGAVPYGLRAEEAYLQLEDHRLAVTMLRDRILDPAFSTYSPEVRAALLQELKQHHSQTYGAMNQPDNFDDSILEADSASMERSLLGEENDLNSMAGMASVNGVPLGL